MGTRWCKGIPLGGNGTAAPRVLKLWRLSRRNKSTYITLSFKEIPFCGFPVSRDSHRVELTDPRLFGDAAEQEASAFFVIDMSFALTHLYDHMPIPNQNSQHLTLNTQRGVSSADPTLDTVCL